jgi:hypothetical protein
MEFYPDPLALKAQGGVQLKLFIFGSTAICSSGRLMKTDPAMVVSGTKLLALSDLAYISVNHQTWRVVGLFD